MSEETIIKRIGKIAQSGAGSEVYLKKEELEKVGIKQGDQVSIEFKTDGLIQIKKCGLDKRTTIVVEEENWKRYMRIAGQKLTEGKGILSFGRYVNACMEKANFSVDELIEFLKRQQK